MPGFKKELNLDPREIPLMDLSGKQECMTEIERRRKTAWVYSALFCAGVLAFIFLYSLFSMLFMLKQHQLAPSINKFLFLIPVFIFLPAFFAHSMNDKCIIWACIAYMLAGLFTIVTGELINAWIAPFAFAGSVVYFRLSKVCDAYYALEKEKGFPDFCDITETSSALAAIEKKESQKDESLNPLTEIAILAAKKSAENNDSSPNEDVTNLDK